jgi:hypothetical protein
VDCLRTNPRALQVLLMNMVVYLHLWPFSRHVIRELEARIADIDEGRWSEPDLFVPANDELPAPVRAVA